MINLGINKEDKQHFLLEPIFSIRHSVSTFLTLAFLLFTSAISSAQNNIEEKSINVQYEEMLNRSGNYLDFKVVKRTDLNNFYQLIQDSLKHYKKQTTDFEATVRENQLKISGLQKELTSSAARFEQIKKERSTVSFFGTPLKKQTYKLLVWIFGLILVLVVLILSFRFKAHRKATKKAKTRLANLEEEYEEHRKRSLEREQVLRRKLQDELNKQRKKT